MSESNHGSNTSPPSEAHDEIDADRPRKRRRLVEDDLEASYFRRLAEEEEREQQQHDEPNNDTSSEASTTSNTLPVDDVLPVHESLTVQDIAADKSKRTTFLSNVSITAIKSKSSKKILLDHLESVLGKKKDSDKSSIESIRFRSTAYVADAGPKRAAFAKKELMEQTAHSTNAYVVFSTEEAAKKVATTLNGTVVLDRHLRIDNLANPGLIDHRRCVFVGNLPFVDVETPEDKEDENEQIRQRRLKGKQPADAEEGLWRAFSKAGRVENVRVVRDKETRVGKGFAYVQFADQNGVEAALLLDGKRFPPMLPRTLRVSRAKRARPASRPERRDTIRDRKRASHSKRPGPPSRRTAPINGASRGDRPGKPSKLIFEGHRASAPSDKDSKEKKRAGKPANRSSRRGASFKASGGKKKRDRK